MQRLLNNNNNGELEELAEQKRGIFSMLGASFNSTAEEIERNYQSLMKYYSSPGLEGQRIIEAQKKLRLAYEAIKNYKEREKYFNELKIRSYMCQHLEDYYLHLPDLKAFPFFIFQVMKKKNNKKLLIEFDFVKQTVTETDKNSIINAYLFGAISSALYGECEDELVINSWDSGKIRPETYVARFSKQRNLIISVFNIAKNVFDSDKPSQKPLSIADHDLKHLNLIKHYAPSREFSLSKIYWKDRVLPPKRDKKFKAFLQRTFSKQTVFLEVGITQLLIFKDPELTKILNVIPLSKDCLHFIAKNHNLEFFLSDGEILKLTLDKDQDVDQFSHLLRKSLEINPAFIRLYYEIAEPDPFIKMGLKGCKKEELGSKYKQKIQACDQSINKMTLRVEQLLEEEQNEFIDAKFWEKNQGIIYSKLGNQKKQKQKATVGLGFSGISHFINPAFSSLSCNNV